MKLHELDKQKGILLDFIIENEGEITTEIAELETELEIQTEKKIDSLARVWRFFDLQIKAQKEETDFQKKKLKSLENGFENFKKFLTFWMRKKELITLEGEKYKITFQKNGGVEPLETSGLEAEKFFSKYPNLIKETKTYSWNREQIELAITSNQMPEEIKEYIYFRERGESLRCK